MVSTKILSSTTVFNIDSTNQHIRMISEGSCDTEEWSNDAEYFYRNKIHFKNKLNALLNHLLVYTGASQ